MTAKHYIIVDIETTGLSKTQDRIIEIAAVRFDGTHVLDSYQTFVQPGRRISGFIKNFTWIDDAMVADAPIIQDVLPSFFDFLGDDVFVAHNASFDHGFIAGNAHRHLRHTRNNHVLCTRKLANRMLAHLPSKSLGNLCGHYDIVNTQAHRAMADVVATTEILRNFIDMYKTYHTEHDSTSLLTLQKKTVGFGKSIFGG